MARRCETCPMLDRCNEVTTGVCMMEDIDETMLAENSAGSAGDDSSYLYEFIFEACEYFSSLGYICNSSEIFSVISDMHGGQMDVKKLLSAMITHSYQEALMFNKVYEEFVERYYHRHREERNAKNEHEKNKQKINEKLQRLTGRQKELMEQREAGQKESKEVRKAQQTEELQKSIKNLDECLEGQKHLKNLVETVKSGIKPEQSQLMKEVKAASMKACMKPNSSELMEAIRERGKQLKAIKDLSLIHI